MTVPQPKASLEQIRARFDGEVERFANLETGQATTIDAPLPAAAYDVIVAAAVLHHLRTDDEWRAVFARLHAALRPGGSIWIWDLVAHRLDGVQALMWRRYGEYLAGLGGAALREQV